MSIEPTRYRWRRTYSGPITAMVLDWSGTTVDPYVIAPAVVFVDVFARRGVPITVSEAREPMGLRKDLHIQALLETPAIRRRWVDHHGSEPDAAAAAAMFADFVPRQLANLPQYVTLLPGILELQDRLHSRNIRIGITTGFTREMVDVIVEEVARHGFHPDATVAGDEAHHGARPQPFMLYRNLDLLGASPIESVIKVDDTVGGIGEGLAAGCWTVGIARYSNYMDVDSRAAADALTPDEITQRLSTTRDRLAHAGAHYVVDEPIDLLAVVDDVEARLRRGERP